MTRDKIYFVSDVHLGSGYHADPMAVERRLVRWLESVRPSARAVYFLGDIFDYWFEYRKVVPQGYVRFLGLLGLMSDEGIEIHFFAGNHDVWFADYLPREIGATIHHRAEIVQLMGKTFRLAHGDEEYSQENWKDRLIYNIFRSRICRALYAAVHPRWTVGLAESLSLRSRRRGLQLQTIGRIPHAYHNEYFDVEKELLVTKAKEYSQEIPEVDYFLFGHRHLMLDMALRNDKRVIILGDWLRYNSYAVWDGSYLSLEQFEVID